MRFLRRMPILAAVVFAVISILFSAPIVSADVLGRLVKSASSPAVYYVYNGARYAYPTERVFYSWYTDFSQVETVSDNQLAAFPLWGNVTYRPGTRFIKITTDPRVYAVSTNGVLRWISSEEVARAIYGEAWATNIDDVADPFFINYRTGTPIITPADYSLAVERNMNGEFHPPAIADPGPVVGTTPPVSPPVGTVPTSTPPVVTPQIRADNWREQAMELPIQQLVRSVDSNGLLHLMSDGGKYEFILPNLGENAEAYGRFSLYFLKRNTELTQAILGREPYQLPNRIVERFVIDPAIRAVMAGGCCGRSSEGHPLSWYFASEADFLHEADLSTADHAYILNRWNAGQLPSGDHELVHRFVVGQMLMAVFNEGLANYLPRKLIGHLEPSYECRADGYIESGDGIVHAYMRPDRPYDPAVTNIYASGECFWQILERTYGEGLIPQIFARLQYVPYLDESWYGTRQGYTEEQMMFNNMANVFVPVLGPSAWTTFAGFGVTSTYPVTPTP